MGRDSASRPRDMGRDGGGGERWGEIPYLGPRTAATTSRDESSARRPSAWRRCERIWLFVAPRSGARGEGEGERAARREAAGVRERRRGVRGGMGEREAAGVRERRRGGERRQGGGRRAGCRVVDESWTSVPKPPPAPAAAVLSTLPRRLLRLLPHRQAAAAVSAGRPSAGRPPNTMEKHVDDADLSFRRQSPSRLCLVVAVINLDSRTVSPPLFLPWS